MTSNVELYHNNIFIFEILITIATFFSLLFHLTFVWCTTVAYYLHIIASLRGLHGVAYRQHCGGVIV